MHGASRAPEGDAPLQSAFKDDSGRLALATGTVEVSNSSYTIHAFRLQAFINGWQFEDVKLGAEGRVPCVNDAGDFVPLASLYTRVIQEIS